MRAVQQAVDARRLASAYGWLTGGKAKTRQPGFGMCPINAVPVPWVWTRHSRAAAVGIKGRDVLADYWNANGRLSGLISMCFKPLIQRSTTASHKFSRPASSALTFGLRVARSSRRLDVQSTWATNTSTSAPTSAESKLRRALVCDARHGARLAPPETRAKARHAALHEKETSHRVAGAGAGCSYGRRMKVKSACSIAACRGRVPVGAGDDESKRRLGPVVCRATCSLDEP